MAVKQINDNKHSNVIKTYRSVQKDIRNANRFRTQNNNNLVRIH